VRHSMDIGVQLESIPLIEFPIMTSSEKADHNQSSRAGTSKKFRYIFAPIPQCCISALTAISQIP
jgi:hypothetical protein